MSNEVPRAANVEVLSDDEAAGLQRTSNPSGQLIIQKNKNRFAEEKERKKKQECQRSKQACKQVHSQLSLNLDSNRGL